MHEYTRYCKTRNQGMEMDVAAVRLYDRIGIFLSFRSLSVAEVVLPKERSTVINQCNSFIFRKIRSMDSDKNYHLGLLYLVHLLINADGVVNENEQRALMKIKEIEKIPADVFEEFLHDVTIKKPREIYRQG